MGKSADEICRLCGSGAETAEHMVCKCPELAGLRTIHMGKPVLDTHEVTAKAPKDVAGLINTIDDLLGFP